MARLVVLVESPEPVVRLMWWGLSTGGFDVVEVDPLAAIDAVQTHDPVCVILNDRTLPRDVLIDIRRVAPEVKIVALGQAAVSELVDARVSLPTTIETVLDTVTKICEP